MANAAPLPGSVAQVRAHGVTRHTARNSANRTSDLDGRTPRHPGYALRKRKRKCVEEIFGWLQTVGGRRRTRHRGVPRVNWPLTSATAAHDLVRMRSPAAVPAQEGVGRPTGGWGS